MGLSAGTGGNWNVLIDWSVLSLSYNIYTFSHICTYTVYTRIDTCICLTHSIPG